MSEGDRLSPRWLAAAMAALACSLLIGLGIGPVGVPVIGIAADAASRLPLVPAGRPLPPLEEAIVWDLRAPRVVLVAPYIAVSAAVILACSRLLDVLRVGDEEARSLGIEVRRVRLVVLAAATVGTAAAISVSGLIGFVGIIVPHAVRLLAGAAYRVILPLSLLFGASFLVLADVAARVVLSPAELPIGVVTAAVGAPFFVLILRTSRLVGS